MPNRLFAPLLLAGLLFFPGALLAQQGESGQAPVQVRVHARIVLIDRAETTRGGLSYVQLGGGRIGVSGRGAPGALPVRAFFDLLHRRRLVRSESEMQVLALSGSPASLSSGNLTVSGWGMSRAQGPELMVTPTVLADGTVEMRVQARLRDEVQGPYGYGIDASRVQVTTTVLARPGQATTVGSVETRGEARDAGFLRWQSISQETDILVVLTPEVLR